MKTQAKPPFLIWLIVILLIFLGIGAMAGGAAFMMAPDGHIMGMPVSQLEKSPFNDFFIPGLVLFTFNGIFPFIVAYWIIKRPGWELATRVNPFKKFHWSWSALLLSGAIVAGWITFQVFWLGYSSFLQPLYFVYGIVLILLGILPPVRRDYSLE